jgi:Leucine-rich repeat (LRR) protein
VMDGLERFSVAQNKLTYLPSPIGRFAALYDLDISYNDIKELPADFGKLPLRRFGYAGNKLKVQKPCEFFLSFFNPDIFPRSFLLWFGNAVLFLG